MIFKVQYTKYFEEFGWEDVDTKEFDNLKDAWAFYLENINDKNVQLWAGKDRLH